VIKSPPHPHDEEMSPGAAESSARLPAAMPLPALQADGAQAGAPARDARLRGMLGEHFDFIWRSLRRFGLSDDRADDAAQQVFVVASQKIDAIQVGSERSFLFGTAMRVASDIRRSAAYRREIAHADPGAELDGSPRPDDLVDQRRARALLDQVLGEMELEVRTVFVLFELEEMTMAEIAELLGIPTGTVASRLRRGREDFEARVKRLSREGGRVRGGGP
jgi:RNA polymerase sigma-70 factor (ECF subfamily)